VLLDADLCAPFCSAPLRSDTDPRNRSLRCKRPITRRMWPSRLHELTMTWLRSADAQSRCIPALLLLRINPPSCLETGFPLPLPLRHRAENRSRLPRLRLEPFLPALCPRARERTGLGWPIFSRATSSRFRSTCTIHPERSCTLLSLPAYNVTLLVYHSISQAGAGPFLSRTGKEERKLRDTEQKVYV
jgi:hypothetical protein